MNIKNLFYLDYWFVQPYIAHGLLLWTAVLFFLLFFAGGLILRLYSQNIKEKINQSILKRFSSLFMTMGLLGLLWMFFRQERVALLAWRIWMLIWFACFVWWLTSILRYLVARAPEIRKLAQERERIGKYLPTRINK